MDIESLRKELRSWAATLRASVAIERWLDEQVWEGGCGHELRHHWDAAERWFWLIPDFESGRTGVVGVEARVLQAAAPNEIVDALEGAHWRRRLKKADLLVARQSYSTLSVVEWNPEVADAWFEDPLGGYFYAYEQDSRNMWTPEPPFLALEARGWSAMGPRSPRAPKTYTAEELAPYLPEAVKEARSP